MLRFLQNENALSDGSNVVGISFQMLCEAKEKACLPRFSLVLGV